MRFQRKNFYCSSGWLTYNNRFVARFRQARDKGPFVTFLIKNFEVDEYFEALQIETPTKVLQTKGYVSSTVKLLLKHHGYPQTLEGFKTFLSAEGC